jgi:predicted O-methyltransferase YrrM
MLNRFKIAFRFLKFYCQAQTKYSIHSPFVFEFVNEVLEDDRNYYVFKEAEILRGELLNSAETIQVDDYGAGSVIEGHKKIRKVSNIAASALSPAFQCRWLFRICNLYKPLTIIELGTSLGISALYMAEGSSRQSTLYTLEGAPEIARLARRNIDWFYDVFKKIGLRRNSLDILKLETYSPLESHLEKNKIQIIVGKFADTLPQLFNQKVNFDLIFIDGHHLYEPTIQYFQAALKQSKDTSIFIFDDIHWSSEMERAWVDIQNNPSVSLTIDLFWCGIVFLRPENKVKEHFKLIQSKYKPFSWGIFR